jgi:hypothetical protein
VLAARASAYGWWLGVGALTVNTPQSWRGGGGAGELRRWGTEEGDAGVVHVDVDKVCGSHKRFYMERGGEGLSRVKSKEIIPHVASLFLKDRYGEPERGGGE